MDLKNLPIQQDTERFRYLFPDQRPVMPPFYTAPLSLKTTKEMIAERVRAS